MAGKTSAEMVTARTLVEKGATAYAAAKATGLTTGAITRSQWYKDRVRAESAKVTPLDRARALVVGKGYTAAAAAKECGIAQSSISRAEWYREYAENLVNKLKPKYGDKEK